MAINDPELDGSDRPAAPPRRSFPWGTLLPFISLIGLLGFMLYRSFWDPGAPQGGIGDLPPLPPPVDDPVFSAVEDRAPIEFRELAAYDTLLQKARETSPETLSGEARRDVLFANLLVDPERYRGLPIRVQGTARRILRIDDLPETIAAEGQLYEAWTFTDDSRIRGKSYPYALVFEDPPEGLPGGTDVDAFVIFYGYFFKLLAYDAGDTKRAAPLLVGRIEYVPELSTDEEGAPVVNVANRGRSVWMMITIGVLVTYLVVRVLLTARNLFGNTPRRRVTTPPPQELSPEELDDFLSGKTPEAEDPPRDEPPKS